MRKSTSVGQANFEWVVEAVSDMAIRKAREHRSRPRQLELGQIHPGGGDRARRCARWPNESERAQLYRCSDPAIAATQSGKRDSKRMVR